MSSLFISHASADATAARATARRLEAWGYRSLFLDFDPEHGIAAGTDWEAQLYRRLKLSRALVALVTESFVASHWCFAEVIQARALGKPVFPLRIAPCAPPSVLADVQIVDLTRNEEEGWERLRRGLEAAGLSEDFPFDAARPYPGLPAFDTGDAGVFHGREEEQAALIETLERMKRRGEPRLALVLGASGSGKSSLVRAGVLPRLGKDPRQWLVIPPWRPGDAPSRELARALAETFNTEDQRWRAIAATLEADATGRTWISLADDLREAKGQRDASVLLVIDQLEELFAKSAGGTAVDAAASFRAQLRAALEAPGSPLFVLATLRSDFLDSFQLAPELRGLPFEALPLGPMPLERLPRVITGPAARAGVELEDGLVERLVADTGSGEALPLLAFTLRQLWERRRNDRLTVELYERELGSIEGAVATIAEGIVSADLGSLEEQALRAAFLRMARLDDEGRLARRRAAWDELPERSRPVIERFVDERLLVSHTADGMRHVEVAHEALFRAWRRLALWLEEERGVLHFRQRLDRARTEWLRVNKAEEALLQGPALAEAERWRESRPDDFTGDERAFVTASTARRQREIDAIRRRRRLVVTGLATGLVVALILSALAGWQWRTAEQQRRLAVAGQLAGQADARLDASGEGLQQSLLLATESLRSAWTAEGYAAWARAVALAPRRPEVWIDAGGASVVALDYHPTEVWVALAGSDGVVRIVDLNSGSTLQALPLVNGALDAPSQWPGAIVRFSPDGIWLAAVGGHKLSIWNTRTWERWDDPVNTEGFLDIAFDRTSERLALSGYHEPLRILAVASKRDLITSGRLDDVPFRAIDFTATHVITATRNGRVAFWQVPLDDTALTKVRQIELAGDEVHDIATGSTQQLLAVSTERSGLRLWSAAAVAAVLKMDPDSPEQAGATPEPTRNLPAGELDNARDSWRVETPPPHTIAFGPGDEHLLTSAATAESRGTRFDASIRIWSVRTGQEVGRIHPGGPAAFAPRGQSLVAGGAQPAVWSLPARGSAHSFSQSSEVRSVAFSPDGRWLAAGLDDGTLVVRRTGSWPDPVALKLGGPVMAVGFTPDSRWLVAQGGGETSDATLHILQTETWKAAPPRAHEDGFTMRVSPDSRFLLTHTPSEENRYKGITRASRSRLWEISSGAEIAWRSHEREDKSQSGKISIAEGTLPIGQHGDMTVLEQAKEWPLLPLRRRSASPVAGGMNYGHLSPDDRWLAGHGGRNASQGLALLEPATGRRLVMLRPANALIADIDFSPDGRWLASAEDDSLDLWLLGPVEALIGEACTRLSRNLTVAEWSMFGSGTPPTTCDRLRVPAASTPPRDKGQMP